MTLGAVREPRRGARHSDLTGRRKRELRDVRHSQRPDLRIERVLVSPSGIHVVASLHLEPGAADLSPVDLARAHAAAGVVASLLPQRYRERVRPVLCRVDDVAMAELVDGVLVTSPTTLEHIMASSPPVLSTSEVNDVGLRLDARLEPFPVARINRSRRWRRRHSVLTGLLAAASGAAAFVLTREVGPVPLPW
ncbi:MAG: hypothetical protein ACM3XQ_12060 [Nocardioidaceae bacterium]